MCVANIEKYDSMSVLNKMPSAAEAEPLYCY